VSVAYVVTSHRYPEQVLRLARTLRAWALERVPFDWMVVLSGQDYPIRPLAEIERDRTPSCMQSPPSGSAATRAALPCGRVDPHIQPCSGSPT
jgi:hypothetical protein